MSWKRRIGFPVVRYTVTIQYTRPRPLTLIEEAILRLTRDFHRHPTYGGLNWSQVFDEILCVSDPNLIVMPSLRELVDHGMLAVCGNLQTLQTLTLAETELTQRGREFLERGQLPAVTEKHTENVYYDPLLGRCKQAVRADATVPAFHVPLPDECVTFPGILLAEWYQRERPRWLPRDAVVLTCSKDDERLMWQEFFGEWSVSGDTIQVQFDDPERTQYVASLPCDILVSHLLQTDLVEGTSLNVSDVGLPPLSDLSTAPSVLESLLPFQEAWSLLKDLSSYLILNDRVTGWPADTLAVPCVIRLGGKSEGLKQNGEHNRVEITSRGLPSLQGWLATGPTATILGYLVELRAGTGYVKVPLAVVEQHASLPQPIVEALERMAETLPLPERLALPALWAEAGQYNHRFASQLRSIDLSGQELVELVDQVAAVLSRLGLNSNHYRFGDAVIRLVIERHSGELATKVRNQIAGLLERYPVKDPELEKRWQELCLQSDAASNDQDNSESFEKQSRRQSTPVQTQARPRGKRRSRRQ